MLAVCIDKTTDELHQISDEIAWYEEEARKSVVIALQHKVEIGRRLIRAKDLLPHGKFLAWAQQEFGWTPRHVQNHMALAAHARQISHLAPGASLRMALAAIRGVSPKVAKNPATTLNSLLSVELRPVQRIYFIGEVEEGTLDCEQLMAELTQLARSLGAPKTKWRTTTPKSGAVSGGSTR